jgi:hypothetical protein
MLPTGYMCDVVRGRGQLKRRQAFPPPPSTHTHACPQATTPTSIFSRVSRTLSSSWRWADKRPASVRAATGATGTTGSTARGASAPTAASRDEVCRGSREGAAAKGAPAEVTTAYSTDMGVRAWWVRGRGEGGEGGGGRGGERSGMVKQTPEGPRGELRGGVEDNAAGGAGLEYRARGEHVEGRQIALSGAHCNTGLWTPAGKTSSHLLPLRLDHLGLMVDGLNAHFAQHALLFLGHHKTAASQPTAMRREGTGFLGMNPWAAQSGHVQSLGVRTLDAVPACSSTASVNTCSSREEMESWMARSASNWI